MTVANRPLGVINKAARDAIVDELRACQTSEELLAFDTRFNLETNAGPLYLLICDFLHDRTISRALGAKLLRILLEDREAKLQALNCK